MSPGPLFNPFPGLRPFQADEDHLFFGREKETDELLRRLRQNRFLSVVGTSGSGKSSLVRSGLIPSLYSGFMVDAGSTWRIAAMRPGEDPIGHLAEALNRPDVLGVEGEIASTNPVLLEATLRRSSVGLVDAVRQARIPRSENLLVIVDQFEELFRFRRSMQLANHRDEAVAFVKLLLEAQQQHEAPIYVVLTMRSDFIGDCMEYPGLPEAVNAGQYLVPRLTRDELRSAITGPVAVAGGEISQRLVVRLLNDLGDDQDQLPVLQHALMRTWDHWTRHRSQREPIDIVNYEAVGTLARALSLHAEEAYAETGSQAKHTITDRISKALTDTFPDPRGIRCPTSITELAAISQASEAQVIEIIDVFRHPGRSFLMPSTVQLGSRSIVDISHESLMRCWTRLIAWAEEERVSATTYVRVSQAASWFEQGTAGLWRNPELELGLRWKRQEQPTAEWAARYDENFRLAMEFLDRSERERARVEAEWEQERKRKLRHVQWVATVLGVMLIMAIALAYVALKEKSRAEANLQLAKTAVDESLSSAGSEQAREAADAPQMEELRQNLLAKAEDFYVNYLGKQNPQGESFYLETARTHSRLGDINRLLGKYQDAVNEYQTAITELDRLIRQHPNNPLYWKAQAYSYNWLGETLRAWLQEPEKPKHYRPADAETEYDNALRLQEQLVSKAPENTIYQQELARTFYNRGIFRYSNRDPNSSESDMRHAIQLLEALDGKSTDAPVGNHNPPPSQDLARVYNNLANLLAHEKRLPEASKLLERAITIHKELCAARPDDREYKMELAQFYDNLALVLGTEGQRDLARQNNQQALALFEALAAPGATLNREQLKAQKIRDWLSESDGQIKR